jgi:translation initiation factor IF-2
MAKNLKLNIKNLQLAGALKPKKISASLSKTAPSSIDVKKKGGTSSPPEEEVPLKKRRARIISAPTAPQEAATHSKEELPAMAQEDFDSSKTESSIDLSHASPGAGAPVPAWPKELDSADARRTADILTNSSATPSAPARSTQDPSKIHTQSVRGAPSSEALKDPSSLLKKGIKKPSVPPSKELRPQKKKAESLVRSFDSRDRQGLRDLDNEAWRKRRSHKPHRRGLDEDLTIRPKVLSVHLPISVKDLAQDMKLKASQLIAKLLMQGVPLTLNDLLDDETTVQLLGHEFGCEIEIDRSEEKRIQITDKTIQEEIEASLSNNLEPRSPVVAFMGHVDHGKTSLIDAIRKSNRVASEAGSITQHIGAFRVQTDAGWITILDTPGHEAFSEMRSRGAHVTDVIVLVVAGDEGIKEQTKEAIEQAKKADVAFVVAINKCDKPNFDAEKVYRQLADLDLLPESWGGTTITVNCSALTGEGIKDLLEMTSIQAEVLELKANPTTRARGTVLESQMHKGLGLVATVLVQNGTLRKNDAIVFREQWGRIKTMHDEHGEILLEASPSVPVKITGLSELPLAGDEFIVVRHEKEARELAEARAEGSKRHLAAQAKMSSLERMMANKENQEKKILPLILRADVQGSLEALKNSLSKIRSDKVRLEFVDANVGEISESDIDLASASKATIVGFHTTVESRAEDLIKQKGIAVYNQDIIYHIIEEVKERMRSLLDKLVEEKDIGKVHVKAIFKSSQLGLIAGCQVTEGVLPRNAFLRQNRDGKIIWKGKVASLKREKEEVKEVKEGYECGLLLEGQRDVQIGDVIEVYELTYLEQSL